MAMTTLESAQQLHTMATGLCCKMNFMQHKPYLAEYVCTPLHRTKCIEWYSADQDAMYSGYHCWEIAERPFWCLLDLAIIIVAQFRQANPILSKQKWTAILFHLYLWVVLCCILVALWWFSLYFPLCEYPYIRIYAHSFGWTYNQSNVCSNNHVYIWISVRSDVCPDGHIHGYRYIPVSVWMNVRLNGCSNECAFACVSMCTCVCIILQSCNQPVLQGNLPQKLFKFAWKLFHVDYYTEARDLFLLEYR